MFLFGGNKTLRGQIQNVGADVRRLKSSTEDKGEA